MQLNLTLVGQGLTFGVFVWFTMRYVWPPLLGAIEQREKNISAGIAAGAAGRQQLRQAQDQAQVYLQEATLQANELVRQAEQQSQATLEKAKQAAYRQAQQQIEQAQKQIEHQRLVVKSELEQELSHLLTQGLEHILLKKGVSNEMQRTWIDQAIKEMV